ncbi:hypothetical protein [Paraburkholderia sp. DGU8]|uniref:hypothetical protein n=1 Tax=Paraburkholderia sp. DGU8 TaxID=3161997 RepID=UPI0034673626
MNRKIIGAALGLAILAASCAASAHVDVAVGPGLPVAVETAPSVYIGPPVAYERAPVAVAYRDDGGWRAREWRERREWREHEWRRESWREHEWREHNRWGGY